MLGFKAGMGIAQGFVDVDGLFWGKHPTLAWKKVMFSK